MPCSGQYPHKQLDHCVTCRMILILLDFETIPNLPQVVANLREVIPIVSLLGEKGIIGIGAAPNRQVVFEHLLQPKLLGRFSPIRREST